MSTQTIPAARLREQAEIHLRIYRDSANGYAASLRANRIDWVSANNLINELQGHGRLIAGAFIFALSDVPDERAEIKRLCTAFDAQMDSIKNDLRQNCLLNGPTQRAI